MFREAKSNGQWDYDLYETTGDEDLKKIVQKAFESQYDLCLVCGGDGTVSGVVDELAEREIPFGILPCGTANVFATALDIPDKLSDAFQLLFDENTIKKVDVIQHQDRYYILECSMGVSAQSIGTVSREEKNKLGWLPYIWKGIRKIMGFEPIWFHIEIDGQHHHIKAAEVALFNTTQIGVVNQSLDADVKLDDGILDFYAIRSRTLWDILRIVYFRLIGKPRIAPHLHYWPVKDQVKISTNHPIDFQADGDLQGQTPVSFKVAKQVLHVIVPTSNRQGTA
jgi:YegS/Rv2252/BmrU family lipid kinase